MAVAPTAAADPAADMEGEDMAAAPEAPAEAPEAQGTVIASIVANTDGSFTLMQGDEPESMHNGEEAAEDEGDMAPATHVVANDLVVPEDPARMEPLGQRIVEVPDVPARALLGGCTARPCCSGRTPRSRSSPDPRDCFESSVRAGEDAS